MNDKESGSEAREEQGGKSVAVQRGGLASFRGFEERFEQMERMMDRMFSGFSIQAQSRQEEVDEKGDYRRREIRSNSFSRSLSLPADVDTEAAKAAFKDGVLEITLPKAAAAKGRQVPID